MSDWAVVWLGVIAVSVAAMALLQLAALSTAARVARETTRALRDFQREVQPLIEKAHRIADDAARTTAIAAAQAERLDDFVRMTTERVDETFGLVQDAIAGPLKKGALVVAAARAAMAIFGSRQDRRRRSHDEDDALFVG